jgi:MFS family permease
MKKNNQTPNKQNTLNLLSAVSFFTDISSEMLFPILPLYLRSVGINILQIGILESLSELILGGSKLLFGMLADKYSNNWIFIRIGYIISALCKPLVGLTTIPAIVFGARFLDKFSKAIRTAPRDSELIKYSIQINKTRGEVFGFHRAMDMLGATLGPIITFCIIYFLTKNTGNTQPEFDFKIIFFLAFIPGLIAILLTFLGRNINNEKAKQQKTTNSELKTTLNPIAFLKSSTSQFKFLLFGLFLTALMNGSDMFVILRLEQFGLGTLQILGIYIAYNLSSTILAYPCGKLCNKFGFKNMYLFGLITFSITAFALSKILSLELSLLTMIGYGIFPVLNEVIAKSWLAHELNKENAGTGLGVSLLIQSFGVIISSIALGFCFQTLGGSASYSIISILAISMTGYFYLFTKNPNINSENPQTSISCNPRH